MIVALDFDKTFTLDPPLWRTFLDLLSIQGHQALIVTSRFGTDRDRSEVARTVGRSIPVVFTAMKKKRDVTEKLGYRVDVWIDDHPERIA